MIQSLKSKETSRNKTIENLEKDKIPDVKLLLEENSFSKEE
jgi:hypothetical protein